VSDENIVPSRERRMHRGENIKATRDRRGPGARSGKAINQGRRGAGAKPEKHIERTRSFDRVLKRHEIGEKIRQHRAENCPCPKHKEMKRGSLEKKVAL